MILKKNITKILIWCKAFFSSALSPFYKNLLPNNIYIVGLNNRTVSAEFIAYFISFHLEHRFFMFQILRTLWKALNALIRCRILYGYKINFSGRFRRNEKAVYFTKKKGSIGRYDVKRFLDYAFITARMRLGVTGIKVWLSYASSCDVKIFNKINKTTGHTFRRYLLKNSKTYIKLPLQVILKSEFYASVKPKWKNYFKYAFRVKHSTFLFKTRHNRNLLSKYSYIY